MATTYYERMPPMSASWARALTRSRPGLADPAAMPRIEARLGGLAIDAAWVGRYNAITGMANDVGLPITAPQHLAFPLHMAVLTAPAFPLRVLGVVHARQRIEQRRPVPIDARPSVGVFIEAARQARRGVEIDLVTEFDLEGETIWRGVTTMLALGAGTPIADADSGALAERSQQAEELPADPEISAILRLAPDLGRRFAVVAGDRNPIHLYPLTARPFGFKRPIIHGMWSLARAIAALDGRVGKHDVALTCAFRRPLPLPGTTRVLGWHDGDGAHFAMLDGKGRLALRGDVVPARF